MIILKTKRNLLISLIGIIFCLTACSTEQNSNTVDDYKKTTYALGTIIEINLYDNRDEELMSQLVDRIYDIEQKMSDQIEESEISQINRSSGKEAVKVSEDTLYVVVKALEYAKLSDGQFDPTLGPIIDLWQIGTENAKVPTEEEIIEAQSLVDYTKVIVDEEEQTVYLEEEGMALDLGGIAKGYTADALVEILDEHSVDKAMINLGGNIYAYGEKNKGELWNIAIQKPFSERNEYCGYVTIDSKTVVTSGIYERYFEEDNIIYHHIFDARTGYPIMNTTVSVTVITESSIDADALSTVLFTMTPQKGIEMIEAMEGTECIYIDEDNVISMSSGIKNKFVVTDKEFSLDGEA